MAIQKRGLGRGALERQGRKQQWRLGKKRAAVYALVGGLVIAGLIFVVQTVGQPDARPGIQPGERDGSKTEGLPLTLDRMAGIWFAETTPWARLMAALGADRSFRFDDTGTRLDTNPPFAGSFEIDGRYVTLRYTRGGWTCIVWEASLPEDGRLRTIMVDHPDSPPECQAGPWAGTEVTWTRVSPRSADSVAIAAPAPPDQGDPPSNSSDLSGIWLLEGSDHVLRLTGLGGTYALGAAGTLVENPDDVGTFEVEPDGTITFTSRAESRTCPQGAVTVWENALLNNDALAADITPNACGGLPQGRVSWVRLDPGSAG